MKLNKYFCIIVVLIVMIFTIGCTSMKKTVAQMYKNTKTNQLKIITEENIKNLPKPVQRYFRYTKTISREEIKTVKLKQGGYFRPKQDGKWMPIKAEQYFNIDSVEFIWKGKVSFITAVDKLINGEGSLTIRFFGLIKLAKAEGPEVNQGEALRFLAECIWFPSAFLKDYIKWEAIDDTSAKATIKHRNINASAIFSFDESGAVTKINAKRYYEESGNYKLEDWEISNFEYKEFSGFNLPYKGDVTWKLEKGDYCYDRIEIVDIEFNDPSLY